MSVPQTLPKIFGIVPTYNHEKWIVECLDGLINQTVPLSALVIVVDGSTDNTWPLISSLCTKLRPTTISGTTEPAELLTGFYKNLPCLLTRFSKNYGPSVARNYAIKSVADNKDALLAFCDSDDIYERTKIQESLPYFLENPHIGMVYSDYTTFDENGEQRQFKEPFSKLRLQHECIANSDSLIRLKCFIDCGLFDETLKSCEDYDFWIRLSNKYLVSHIPNSLVKIRVGLHSSTNQLSKEIWAQNYKKVMMKHFGPR